MQCHRFIFNKHLSFIYAKFFFAKPRRKHHVTVTTLALDTLGDVDSKDYFCIPSPKVARTSADTIDLTRCFPESLFEIFEMSIIE